MRTESARPIRPDGAVGPDPATLEARNDAQVRAALAPGPVAVIVLGASHDLTGAIEKHGGTTEYILVTTRAVERIAGWERP
jgi:hypothetical protein